jgi:hypothetical protein
MKRRRTKRRLFLAGIFLALLVIAVAGWTVEGARYALRGGRLAPSPS